MSRKLFYTIMYILVLSVVGGVFAANAPQDWDKLEKQIRDGEISRDDAQEKIRELHPQLIEDYNKCKKRVCYLVVDYIPGYFPVQGYGTDSIGGTNGSGYKPDGYDFYDGNKHEGHPAHDIFIKDTDQDLQDDNTNRRVKIYAHRASIVIAVNSEWDSESEIRGGKYVWLFNADTGRYYYYAHLDEVDVFVGEMLSAGSFIGYMGRTGLNAYTSRSPTHLHFMVLDYNEGKMTPYNTFTDLQKSRKALSLNYRWLSEDYQNNYAIQDISPPTGYKRVTLKVGSFGMWLRGLPLKKKGTRVYLYNGRLKGNQDIHYAVIDIDIGKKDLQQCADAVMRLWGEYLYSQKRYEDIHFKFLNGFNCEYKKYAEGYRPDKKYKEWEKKTKKDYSYKTFRKYLDLVFNYANTKSLDSELKSVKIDDIQPGDVFIQGIKTHYNHAVIVLDVAVNEKGEKVFLIAQSYVPAQNIEVLIAPGSDSPWHSIPKDKKFNTAEWIFYKTDLKRFQD